MIAIRGTGVSGGIAEGPVYIYRRNTVCTDKQAVSENKQAADPSKELER